MMKAVEQPTISINPSESYLHIDVSNQQLSWVGLGQMTKQYPISTGKNGVGEKKESKQTPRGWHIIRAKIGHDCPINTIFVARRPQGELTPALEAANPDKDWILSRILWLSGLEVGKNRLFDCDTMQRYIYIHGTPDRNPVGVPLSHGCIRMRNQDIIELFDIAPIGMKVYIQE